MVFTLLFCFLPLASCINSERKIQKVKDTFDSFENSDEYILITRDEIHVGKRIVNISDVQYDGNPCHIVFTKGNGAYAYSFAQDAKLSVNIVYVDFETLGVRLLSNIEVPSKIIAAEHFHNALYFRMDDPEVDEFKQIYFVYDLETMKTQTVDADALSFDIETSGDHNRSQVFSIEVESGAFNTQLRVTRKDTGESKVIDNALIDTCAEGKTIVKLGKNGLGTGCSTAYEKDGDIYVLYFYLADGFLGEPCYAYVMKYDFAGHTMEYYTAIYFETYPENICDLYIP